MHDRIAELAALRQELDICENGPRREVRSDSVGDVRKEIVRVRGELDKRANELEQEAKELTDKGQDVAAAQATVDARDIREALDQDAEAGNAEAQTPKGRKPQGSTGKRDTSARKPPEQS